MPVYVLKALFVTTGLALIRRCAALSAETEKRPLRALLQAMAGLAALFAANMAGSLAGLGVGLNGLTMPVAAVLGVPGVCLLWAVKYLL